MGKDLRASGEATIFLMPMAAIKFVQMTMAKMTSNCLYFIQKLSK